MTQLISHRLFISALSHEEEGLNSPIDSQSAVPLVPVGVETKTTKPASDSAADWMNRHRPEVLAPEFE